MKAFPSSHPENPHPSDGMDLRDWFAGMALPQIIAAIRENQKEVDVILGIAKDAAPSKSRICAHVAYEYADAMMEARKNAESE